MWVICMLNHTQTLQICYENSTRHYATPFQFLQCKIYMSAEVVTSSGGTCSPHSPMKIRSQLKLLSPLELAETLQDCPCSQIRSLSLSLHPHPTTPGYQGNACVPLVQIFKITAPWLATTPGSSWSSKNGAVTMEQCCCATSVYTLRWIIFNQVITFKIFHMLQLLKQNYLCFIYIYNNHLPSFIKSSYNFITILVIAIIIVANCCLWILHTGS